MSGPQCCENPPALSSGTGTGHVEEIAGLNCYVSGPSESNLGLLLASDVYGYEAPNLRKIADKAAAAAAGFYVVVPDLIHGDPYNPKNAEKPLPIWIKDHGTDKGFEDAKLVIEAMRSKGIVSIGAAGFCWGAKVVTELAKCAYIEAAVLLHPTFVTLEDIHAVKVPISILGAEADKLSPPGLLKKFDEALQAKPEVDAFVKIFPGVAHGWTVRYKDDDEDAVKCADEAHNDLLDWFAKHVVNETRMKPAKCNI